MGSRVLHNWRRGMAFDLPHHHWHHVSEVLSSFFTSLNLGLKPLVVGSSDSLVLCMFGYGLDFEGREELSWEL